MSMIEYTNKQMVTDIDERIHEQTNVNCLIIMTGAGKQVNAARPLIRMTEFTDKR